MSRVADIRRKYDDIINQGSEVSSSISQTLLIGDVGDETSEMITAALQSIGKTASETSMSEKLISFLPSPIANRLGSEVARIERSAIKHGNVSAVANKHFDILAERRDTVKAGMLSLYELQEKVTQSKNILGEMGHELDEEISQLECIEEGTSVSKKDVLLAKELRVQIASQVAIQTDLVNQMDMVDYVGSTVLETLNQTLPEIKANFIDQIAISSTLGGLKKLKDSVDATREMTMALQEETFVTSKSILLGIVEDGIGMKESEIARMEKLGAEKAKLSKIMSEKMSANDRQLDSNLSRIKAISTEASRNTRAAIDKPQ